MSVFTGILLIVIAVLLITGWIFFLFTFSRNGFPMPGKPRLKEGEVDLRSWRNCMDTHIADHAWILLQPFEEVHTLSEDGLKLSGKYYACKDPKRIILCVHGFRGQAAHDFASAGRFLLNHNCDLLLIDQRGTGKSEGTILTFGAKEKRDVVRWCRFLAKRNPQNLPLYAYGISMGCTSVLCAADQGIEQMVNGLIGDCGYSSIRSILEKQARRSFHLPPYPVMYILELYCILLGGFRFSDGSAEQAMRHNSIPVLFFHGGNDHFVTADNTMRNYEACQAEKELVIVEGAVHASSYNTDEQLYQGKLISFFERNDLREVQR